MALSAIPSEHQPSACIACHSCEKVCPQQIHIPDALADFAAVWENKTVFLPQAGALLCAGFFVGANNNNMIKSFSNGLCAQLNVRYNETG